MGHVVYRNWCPKCVHGRGPDDRHGAAKRDEFEIPVISFDYCFLSSRVCTQDRPEGDNPEDPVLVMWDSRSKSIFAHMVAAKGVDNPLADRTVRMV